jgi:hypothetical protein
MREYVKSSPFFFRLIGTAMVLAAAVLLVLAFLFPAPLQEPANPGVVPNPVKSAWFLLWIQELVSYSAFMIYPVMIGALFFLLLPWLPVITPAHRGSWFPRDQRLVSGGTLALFLIILLLTVVASFFRGENWAFVSPF